MRGREKLTKILAWTSFVLAVVGGAALSVTFVGSMITGVVRWLPPWMATVAFVVGVALVALDLAMDGVPNRPAVWLAILLPSVGLAIPGQLSSSVRDGSNTALQWFSGWAGSWLGTTSSYVLAGAGIAVALVLARRTVPERRP